MGGANVNATLFTGTTVSVTGNITGGNVSTTNLTGTTVSVTGNITGGNILGGANVNATTHTGTTVSVSGNITGGNLITSAAISAASMSASGNITVAGIPNFSGSYVVIPTGTTDPATATQGAFYYNTLTSVLRIYISGAWRNC